ncbi:hypothetical protein SARC_07773 [Sphaeroforma arctica JP610]|uniref:Fe2OG dioxygenase domain-containing protein n=1 Tax=Sphaeroforma arctica JP610 TaxID=667725 RepID=A0A0L0FST6_9EUKA|nr:hypothetical protein SARC_07773 [Sphaeroforma arctica JP610]KNC79850.1 hypothetical protein SARC_07773 [Sphaeroforma arctica JP610]|eukprot:XP_014153752.1 hypothetical protein SARC_07773 [Sphaeroforma arctica JP610]
MPPKKSTLEHFFKAPPSKRTRNAASPSSPSTTTKSSTDSLVPSSHPTYQFAIPQLPNSITESLEHAIPSLDNGKRVDDQPHLDLVHFHRYLPRGIEASIFDFLRENLFFYRVQYAKKFGNKEMQINTPRYTTVFGVDESSFFNAQPGSDSGPNVCVECMGTGACNHGVDTRTTQVIFDSKSKCPVPKDRYSCRPRPIPDGLMFLKKMTEASTAQTYNFCLVNYYADGNDSISYHSDDERFLGANPAIASFSLGTNRDFLMKHKPDKKKPAKTENVLKDKPLKLTLDSGDMLLMRGAKKAKWLHSIPKRKGGESGNGRINITFRKAMVPGGTENYYKYNVGEGGTFKWSRKDKNMIPWTS